MKYEYRQAVQRVLAKHHARLELGLSRSREQEPFVMRVAACLHRAAIPYYLQLTDDLDAVFVVPSSYTSSIHTLLACMGGIDVGKESFGWVVSDAAQAHIQVQIMWETQQ